MKGCLRLRVCRSLRWLRRSRGAVGVVVLCGFLVGGCGPKAMRGDPVDLRESLGRDEAEGVPDLEAAGPALGPEVPYVPVVTPPKVQRVWIPAHVDDVGDMVAGHWIYLMLERSRWFVEEKDGQGERRLNFDAPANIGVRPGQSVLITPEELRGFDGEGSGEGD